MRGSVARCVQSEARSDWRSASSPGAPDGNDFDELRKADDSVVDVVVNPFDMKAPNAWQLQIPSTGTNPGLKGDQRRDSLKLFPNRVRRLEAVLPPPRVELTDLRLGELADLDAKRNAHSRLRSSSSTFSIGTVCPRSHCAMDSRSIRSVSASASNVSSPSGRSTVTNAPSGSSASSSSTRPSMIRPEATRICAFYRARLRCPTRTAALRSDRASMPWRRGRSRR